MTKSIKKIAYIFLLAYSIVQSSSPENDPRIISIKIDSLSLTNTLTEISILTDINFTFPTHVTDSIIIDEEFYKVEINDLLEEILFQNELNYRWSDKSRVIVFEKEILYSLKGTVLDSETGERLPHASIYIDDHNYTFSNRDGVFNLVKLRKKAVSLEIRYMGYKTENIEIDLQKNDYVNLQLKKSSILSDSVVIISKNEKLFQFDRHPGLLSVNMKEFDKLPQLGEKDVFNSISLLPGINSDNFGSSGVSIRGGSPSENLVLLDGITLYHINHAFGFYTALNNNIIKDVQIYKGGYPAEFGGRTSGLINFTSKSGSFRKVKAIAGINRSSANLTLELPLGSNLSFIFAGRNTISDFLLTDIYRRSYANTFNRVVSADIDDPIPVISFYDLFSKVTYLPDNNNLLTVSFFHGKDNFSLAEKVTEFELDDTLITFPGEIDFYNHLNSWGNTGSSARWFRQPYKNFNFETILSYSKYFADGREINNFPEYNEEDDVEIMSTQIFTKNTLEDLSIQFNSEYKFTSSNSFNLGASYSGITSFFSKSELISNESELIDKNAKLFTAYSNYKYRVSNLEANIGFRLSNYSITKLNRIEPRLSINYKLTDRITAKVFYGKFNQYIIRAANSVENIEGNNSWFLIGGSTKLNRSEQFSFGLNYSSENLAVDAEAYRKNVDGFFSLVIKEQFLSVDNFASVENNSSGTVDGIDFIAKLSLEKLKSWVSYSYNSSETEFLDRNETKFNTPFFDEIKHSLKFALSYNLFDNFTFSLVSYIRSGKPILIPELTEEWDEENEEFVQILEFQNDSASQLLPTSKQVDVSMNYQFNIYELQCRLNFTLFNVFNNRSILNRFFYEDDEEIHSYDIRMLGFKPVFSFEIEY